MKQFEDDNFKFDEIGRKFFKQIENTEGKGEIAGYKQFLPFPSVFSKGLQTCKNQSLFRKGLNLCFKLPTQSGMCLISKLSDILCHDVVGSIHGNAILKKRKLTETVYLSEWDSFMFEAYTCSILYHDNIADLTFKESNLTHFRTMLHFDALKIYYSCGKYREKSRNCLLQAISPFLTMFSTLYGTYFSF